MKEPEFSEPNSLPRSMASLRATLGGILAVEKLVDGKPQDVPSTLAMRSRDQFSEQVLSTDRSRPWSHVPSTSSEANSRAQRQREVNPEKLEGFSGVDSQDIELIKNL